MRNENQNIEYKESWGRGYKKIREELDKAGMPMPTIQEVDGGVMAVIKRFSMEEIIAQRSEEMSGECR